MTDVHFSDVGHVDAENVTNFEVLEATEPGEAGSVSGKKDTVRLRFRDGSTRETHDPLGIKLLKEALAAREG